MDQGIALMEVGRYIRMVDKKGTLNERTLHLISQKIGFDNGTAFPVSEGTDYWKNHAARSLNC
jgi:hypothetical protein